MTNDEALNNLEDRLECAIAHINTSVDIDPWAQKLAVESMRMRIALMKGGQPDIIRCKDCKHWMPYDWMFSEVWQSQNMDDYPEKEIGCQYCDMNMSANDFCSRGERRTDGFD